MATLLPTGRAWLAEADPHTGVALDWLAMVRWAGVIAGCGAIFAGWRGLGVPTSLVVPALVVTACAASNVWLIYRLRRPPTPAISLGGWLVSADVVALSVLLLKSGGVLNPISIFYLVDIVLAALVLGRTWTWQVAALSIVGYGVLFMLPSQELQAARSMHPEIAMHVEGMWLAFAATALIVAILVARLATLVDRRDQALALLRDRRSRDAHLVSLATLAAGAAHELSTPLGTIAVAARELEHSLADSDTAAATHEDVRLILQEVDRCKRVLQDMAGRSGELSGEAPTPHTLDVVGTRIASQLNAEERVRIDWSLPSTVVARWPIGAVSRALANLVRNGLQASAPGERVSLTAVCHDSDHVVFTVTDTGAGMPPAIQARAGEPFYTTRTDGTGMGLGLFVSASTIEQLGGTMRLSSTEGRGTTVEVVLPCDPTTSRAT